MNFQSLAQLIGSTFPFKNNSQFAAYLREVNTPNFQLQTLEKDFYLTALLIWVSRSHPDLIFKGGTCLNKIHYPYFRLSEDLDFTRSVEKFSLSQLKQEAYRFDKIMHNLTQQLGRKLHQARHTAVLGTKKYTYLGYELEYQSAITHQSDTILFEISYMPHQHLPSHYGEIRHVYNNIMTGDSLFPSTKIQSLSLDEMFAEKFRAALTRHTPAIRDFYDIFYMIDQGYQLQDHSDLIATKYQESLSNKSIPTIEYFLYDGEKRDTFSYLKSQVQERLGSVIPNTVDFDLQDIYTQINMFRKEHLH